MAESWWIAKSTHSSVMAENSIDNARLSISSAADESGKSRIAKPLTVLPLTARKGNVATLTTTKKHVPTVPLTARTVGGRKSVRASHGTKPIYTSRDKAPAQKRRESLRSSVGGGGDQLYANDLINSAMEYTSRRSRSRATGHRGSVTDRPDLMEISNDLKKLASHTLPSSSGTKCESVSLAAYSIGKTIGEGTFGKVKRGLHKLTGIEVSWSSCPD